MYKKVYYSKLLIIIFINFSLLFSGCFLNQMASNIKKKNSRQEIIDLYNDFTLYSIINGYNNPDGYNLNYVYSPNFSLSSGSYSSDIIVEINTKTVGAIIHYTMNGDDPTESSPIYLNPIAISGNGTIVTIKAIAIKINVGISEISTATYQINWRKCSTPNFNPPSGSFTGIQTISITSDAGATIKYTTDGSDPKTSGSSIMGSSVNANYCMTIKAYAYAVGRLDSDVSSADFTIVKDLGYVGTNDDVDIIKIVSGPDNRPIVLCRENYQTGAPLYNYYNYNRVYKWNSGTTWDDLGYFTGIADNSTHIAVGSDNIPVVFIKDTNDNDRGRVMKWNAGTTWTDLGHVSVDAADNLSIAVGGDNKPVVAFCDFDNSWRVHVQKWDSGVTWTDLGFVSDTWKNYFIIAAGGDNKPVVMIDYESEIDYKKHILKWDSGTLWSDLNYPSSIYYTPLIMAICQDNLPIAMYYDSTANNALHVIKYNSTASWSDMGFPSDSNNNAIYLSSNRYSNPVAVYSTGYSSSSSIRFVRWISGTSWENIGAANFAGYNYAVNIGADAYPIIAYIEGNNYSGRLCVKKLITRP